ncbi:MAG TPA: DegT/DnrJ/EryC1/StrS family aminotransferase [Acetobacteraceae bacterium]|nr:DegT/DnrJ/EryC1/StrS family aminotransferase [Acetobacteraceae bacterium]
MSGSIVPQANPGAAYRAHKQEIDAAISRALDSGWYILGQEGRAFETEFAAWLGAGTVVGCGNGTDAIALALRGLGIGAGSTVVTVSHTAVATVAAIESTGAVPLLIDVEPDHYTMDPAELAQVLADPPAGLPPVRAVIPVHLYGQVADVEVIGTLCRRHGMALIEDCAQAHGAKRSGRLAGTFGDAATFSFYPTKNLGALGDGGAVVAREPAVAARIATLRHYGWARHYISDEVGINSRLDELQAAVLRVKLGYLDAANARRRDIARAYDAVLGARAPRRRRGSEHVYHQYVVRTPERDRMQATLRERGVGSGIHYPVPVHLQPAYANRVLLGPSGCAVTERAAAEVLSLPLYPELTEDQVGQVCRAIDCLAA